MRSQACQQRTRTHRLGHIVIRARLQTQHLIDLLTTRGQHDDRAAIVGAHRLANCEAIQSRQVDIQHQLNLKDAQLFVSSFERSNLFIGATGGQERFAQLIRFLERHQGEDGILYSHSRKSKHGAKSGRPHGKAKGGPKTKQGAKTGRPNATNGAERPTPSGSEQQLSRVGASKMVI